jgi:S-adenosyl methyltransferase
MAAGDTPGERRQSQPEPIEIARDVAHPARVYDYVRGGDDNFTADREVADFAAAAGSGGLDHARAAVQANQAFHSRAVTYLAGNAGIRQFLEIGTGIPTDGNTHEIAQRIAPQSRVVYTDDDPVVLAHAHTLRKSTPTGATAYVNADPRDPDTIIGQAQTILDLDQPIAVLIVAILHHIREEDDPYSIVARFVNAVPSGSFLVISHLTSDIIANEVTEAARRINEQPGFTLVLRTYDQICRLLDGTEPLTPGLVPVDRWHAPGSPPPPPGEWPTPFYGAVARKP